MRLIPLLPLFYLIAVSAIPAYEGDESKRMLSESPANVGPDHSAGSDDYNLMTKRSQYGGNYNGSRRSSKSIKQDDTPEPDSFNSEETSVGGQYEEEDINEEVNRHGNKTENEEEEGEGDNEDENEEEEGEGDNEDENEDGDENQDSDSDESESDHEYKEDSTKNE